MLYCALREKPVRPRSCGAIARITSLAPLGGKSPSAALGGHQHAAVDRVLHRAAGAERDAVDQVAALDVDGGTVAVLGHHGGAVLLLDPLGGRFADQQVVVAAHVAD